MKKTATILFTLLLVGITIWLIASRGNGAPQYIARSELPEALLDAGREMRVVILPETISEIVYRNRNEAFPPIVAGAAEVLNSFLTPNLDPSTDAEIVERIRRHSESDYPPPTTLTHEEIAYELDFMFLLLRYSYGAYGYFGGDEVFIPLKESMLEQLAQMSDPLDVDSYFYDLLVPNLQSVIADNHVAIFTESFETIGSMGVRSQLYMNNDFILQKDETGYILEIDGEIYRVGGITLCDGLQIYGVLPTLSRDGELVWAFGHVLYGLAVDAVIAPVEISVTLECVITGNSHNMYLNLYPVANANISHRDMYAITESNGIPILRNRRLQQFDGDPPVQHFADTGAALRDEPVLILDLRGHSGGGDGYAADWIYQLTGYSPNYGMMFTHMRLYTLTACEINPWITATLPPRWDVWDTPADLHRFISNENLVIVLTDNAIGSAGDSFVGFLRQLENVLIVGTNTSGTLVTGNVAFAVLPMSRLQIALGNSLNIRTDFSQFEGVGFMPDLWVSPNDSLQRVLRMIDRYEVRP